MSLSMQSQQNGSWQTVKPKADDKKKRDEKKKQKDEPQRDRLGVPVESNVFASIDSQWRSKAKQQQVEEPEETPYEGVFSGLDVEKPISEEPETPTTPPAVDAQAGSSVQEKKGKAKAPKKPKVTLQQVAEGVDIQALRDHVVALQAKYPEEQLAQVMMLGDHLLRLFREVDLPFNNLLQEKPLYQAAEVPVSGVPAPLAEVVSRFIGGVPQGVLSRALVELMTSVFEGLPDSYKSKAAPQPPRAKVGILLLLALLLRAAPAALLDAAPQLLAAGRTFTSGPRLLHLLWVIHQAAISSEVTALAVWVRVLLPQLLGSAADLSVPAPSGKGRGDATADTPAAAVGAVTMDAASQESALDYAVALLAMPGVAALVAGGAAADLSAQAGPSAVVPAASVEAIARACFVDGTGAGIRPQTRTRLSTQLYPSLASLAASSRSDQQHVAWVPLLLETAATLTSCSFQAVEGDEVVQKAAASLLSSLLRCDGAFGVWEVKHKGSIKGSSRVLQYLAQAPAAQVAGVREQLAALLADGHKRELLHQLLGALRRRHSHYLAQGKGWQGAAARASEAAVHNLERRTASSARSTTPLHAAALTLAALSSVALALALAAHHNAVVSPLVGAYLGRKAQQEVAAALQQLQAVLEPYTLPAIAAATPHVQQAVAAATPYAAQAAEASGPYIALAREYVQQAVVAAAPALEAAQKAAEQGFEAARPLLLQAQEALQQLKAGLAKSQ